MIRAKNDKTMTKFVKVLPNQCLQCVTPSLMHVEMGNDQNGPWTKTAHSTGPKRPTATSKTAHADVQNGPRLGQKRPTEFLLFVSVV